ncbi:unnamed protein product, partial [Prorocentrum cordatum]
LEQRCAVRAASAAPPPSPRLSAARRRQEAARAKAEAAGRAMRAMPQKGSALPDRVVTASQPFVITEQTAPRKQLHDCSPSTEQAGSGTGTNTSSDWMQGPPWSRQGSAVAGELLPSCRNEVAGGLGKLCGSTCSSSSCSQGAAQNSSVSAQPGGGVHQ